MMMWRTEQDGGGRGEGGEGEEKGERRRGTMVVVLLTSNE